MEKSDATQRGPLADESTQGEKPTEKPPTPISHEARGGRPTKCTPDARVEVCNAIRDGMTYADAAVMAGIGYSTFRDWMRRGEEGEEPFFEFMVAAEQAALDWKASAIKGIAAAGTGAKADWRASAFLLERRHPDQYGRGDSQTRIVATLRTEAERVRDAILRWSGPDAARIIATILDEPDLADVTRDVFSAGLTATGLAVPAPDYTRLSAHELQLMTLLMEKAEGLPEFSETEYLDTLIACHGGPVIIIPDNGRQDRVSGEDAGTF